MINFLSAKNLKVGCYEICEGVKSLNDNSQQVKVGSASYCSVWENLKENWDFKRSLQTFSYTSSNFTCNISKCKAFTCIENKCNILLIHLTIHIIIHKYHTEIHIYTLYKCINLM